jgi:hypothetical protein
MIFVNVPVIAMYPLLLMLIKDGTHGIEICNKSAKILFESLALT